MYDRLTCIMAAANHRKDREGRPYGPHYGRLAADTTEYERDLLEAEGRMMLTKRDALRRAAREAARERHTKGEGQWKSDPARKRRTAK